MWWSIVHSTRTQHFLTGDRLGIVREVEIEYDPVIKDVDLSLIHIYAAGS